MIFLKRSSKIFFPLLLFGIICSGCEISGQENPIIPLDQPTITSQWTPSSTSASPTETAKQDTPSLKTFTPAIKPAESHTCTQPGMLQNLPEGLKKGTLLLYDRQDNKVIGRTLSTEETLDLSDAQFYAVYASPDNVSYAYLLKTDTEEYQLAYVLSGDRKAKTIPLKENIFGEFPIFSGWINNHMVAFEISGHQPTTLVAIDLNLPQMQTLVPDFPGVYSFDPWSWGDWGRTVYSPDLHYVVFPRLEDANPYQYVLWDMQEKKVVNFMAAGHPGAIPQWAPDGKKFAVGREDGDFSWMDVDGKITNLINLRERFPSYTPKIRLWNWSPDSQRIAFWLDLYLDGKLVEERLFVLDTQTLETTDYCNYGDMDDFILGTPDYSPAPIWSPDGNALIIENRTASRTSQLLVVDLRQHVLYQIGESLFPYAWLSK